MSYSPFRTSTEYIIVLLLEQYKYVEISLTKIGIINLIDKHNKVIPL